MWDRTDSWRLAALVTGACVLGWVSGASLALLHSGKWGQTRREHENEDENRANRVSDPQDGQPSSTSALPSPTVSSLIGNTPLVHLKALSAETGCTILAKAEFLNPGGSIKDRVALQIIQDAFESGALRPGGLITEGTVGSTGVSLAMLAPSYGCQAFIAMPDDAAEEKSMILRALGAEVARVRPVSISHPDHFVHVARRRADEASAGEGTTAVFADQFENLANFKAHIRTGGTMAGVGTVLKRADREVQLVLADPPGSGLYNKIKRGVMYTKEEAEGKRLKNPFDTITEGVGINRLTANFETIMGAVDDAVRVSDEESVDMSRYLLREEGLFVGSSSAVNVCGAVKVAERLGPGHVVVTILCDGGARHLSKFWSASYVERYFDSKK